VSCNSWCFWLMRDKEAKESEYLVLCQALRRFSCKAQRAKQIVFVSGEKIGRVEAVQRGDWVCGAEEGRNHRLDGELRFPQHMRLSWFSRADTSAPIAMARQRHGTWNNRCALPTAHVSPLCFFVRRAKTLRRVDAKLAPAPYQCRMGVGQLEISWTNWVAAERPVG
jgi:hypothetical protein